MQNEVENPLSTIGYIEPGRGMRGKQQWLISDEDLSNTYHIFLLRKMTLLLLTPTNISSYRETSMLRAAKDTKSRKIWRVESAKTFTYTMYEMFGANETLSRTIPHVEFIMYFLYYVTFQLCAVEFIMYICYYVTFQLCIILCLSLMSFNMPIVIYVLLFIIIMHFLYYVIFPLCTFILAVFGFHDVLYYACFFIMFPYELQLFYMMSFLLPVRFLTTWYIRMRTIFTAQAAPLHVCMAEIRRVRELLAQVVQCLDGGTSSQTTSIAARSVSGCTSHSLGNVLLVPSSSRVGSPSTIQASRVSALAERNCLFNFSKTSSSPSGRKSKKKCLEMWNHDFVCLAKADRDRTPTAMERATLTSLGEIGVYL